jgi:uncharacterized protein YabN with tetrapyrrole methylase and pyrophosphatase domain
VTEALPALLYARKLQRRAAGGSDRGDPTAALDEVRRALERTAADAGREGPSAEDQEQTRHASDALYEAVGKLLFTAVEVARALQVDPEIALRRTADRFRSNVVTGKPESSVGDEA